MKLFWKRLERFPPVACRLLARLRYGRPLTTEEIAKASGLTAFQVEALSQSVSWRGVDIFQMRAFSNACGLDFTATVRIQRVEKYLKSKPTWRYLRVHPNWKTYYFPLLQKWQQSIPISTSKSTSAS